MKTYLKIIALLCFISLAIAASAQCPQGNVVLLSQEDVNEFGTLYPDCTELESSLHIGEPATQGIVSNINNLNPLNEITYIGGDFTVGQNSPNMTLEGLSNLDSIGGSLMLNTGVTLASFTGLENLQVIGGDLSVTTLAMADFTGLENLHSVGGSIIHGFANHTGLENLTTIGGDFYTFTSLNSFQGLNNLASIGGDFYTSGSLNSFQGLNNLTSVGGHLLLGEEHNFTDFSGLESLITIGGGLFIAGEDANLNSFAGLENLMTIGGDFSMYECNDLYDFSNLENLNTIGGNLELDDIHNDIDTLNFPNLSAIGVGINIEYCSFSSLGGLENLTDFGNLLASPTWGLVPGEIRLKNNSVLTDISAISHLSIDTLTIINNPNLSVCGIESICEYLAQGGAAAIENNAGGCDTVGDILQVCNAQCPPEDVVLLSQEDVNEYATLYPNCTEIYGNLTIGTQEAAPPTDIIDLTPLSNMTAIAGDLVIGRNDALMTLGGLSNIDTLSGSLIVGRQSTLTDFTGLENLNVIDNNLIINPETNLVNGFAGLDNLLSIGGDFSVEEHTFSFAGLERFNTIHGDFYLNECVAANFQGLNKLAIIHGDFVFDEGNTFDDFTGLEDLGYIGGSFYLYDDNNISSLSGLSQLTLINRSLLISDVGNTDFTDLESLSGVGGGIKIQFCNALTSLAGLENLTNFGTNGGVSGSSIQRGEINLNSNEILNDISAISDLTIRKLVVQQNDNLSICNIESVCNYLAQVGVATIENNAEGCNTPYEVVQGCGFDCPTVDVVLLSQEDVNQFGTLYPDCTELEVNLEIGNSVLNDPSMDISDLSPLNNIATIAGDLMIKRNDSLTTLEGLSGLSSLGNNLIIRSLKNAENLEGLENLTVVNGDFIISGENTVGSLVGLENLNTIGGRLLLDTDNSLTNLQGLDNLTSIGEDLILDENTELENFVGLENLISIGGDLFLDEESELQNFIGLDNLTSIGGDLRTNGDGILGSFSGLESLIGIGGSLHISTEVIVSLNGLENLTTIEGNMYLRSDVSNTDLSSFENLSTIGGGLYIRYSNIESLNGLESVTDFGNFPFVPNIFDLAPGEIRLMQNDELTDISAISHFPIDTLTITNNNSLSVCGIQSICEHLVQGGAATIENNAEGCNTIEEIIESCSSLLEYTIEGNIYADTNADCSQDAGESGLDDWLVKIEEDNQLPRYAYTFGDGNYITLADSGAQYTITAIPPNMLWDNICPTSEIVSISAGNPHDGVNFGANGSTLCPLLEVDATAPFVRRCFESNYYVSYCNSGTAIAENAYVEVQLDPFFTFQNSTIADIDLGENLYSFDLGNVDIGECGNFRIDVYVDCDSTEIGQTHCVEAHIFPDSICTPALPLWDQSSIIVDAQCLGDSIEFRIENTGAGDMSDSLEYLVVEDDLIYQRANFKLNSGDTQQFYKLANGEFHRLEAEQSPGHPGNSMPSVFVEGCGVSDDGEISVGYVNYYLLDEGDAFVSIDCQENVGSYDPNDKQAFPVGYGASHYITDSTDLEYMIRFQNTGTDTAFTVVIRDTISPHLNIETLRPGVSSHDYRYDIEESNIAVFHFENIMLPDSNVNEVASHGFIKFNIEQNRDNPIGTHIMNDAAIYFDFNEPIITNTVFHTVGEDFMGLVTSIITPPEVLESGISVNVFPNPFDEYTRFEVQGEAVKELNLSVYDMMGREVLQQQSTHQQHITIKRNNLTLGVYIFRLMDEKQQLATGKLVIK